MKAKPSIPPEVLERMAQMLRLLAHPHRLRIIEMIDADKALPVHRLVEGLGLPQGATSQHLNAMKRVNLLAAERRGKEVWYSIADPRALTILDCIRKKHGGRSS